MKQIKVNIILLVSIISLLFSGCQSMNTFELSYSLDEVESISIVGIYSDSGEMKTISLLGIEDAMLLVEELINTPCYKYWNDPCQTLSGDAIKVVYINGDYEIITSSANALYAGSRISFGREYFDKSLFENIIQKYTKQ